MNIKCIICNNFFVKKIKSSAHNNFCCSYHCLRKTGVVRKKFLITALKKRNIPIISEDDLNHLEEEY